MARATFSEFETECPFLDLLWYTPRMYRPTPGQGHCTYIPVGSYIMGHSWSCLEAINLSAKYYDRIRGLILISPCFFGHHPIVNQSHSSMLFFKRNKTLAFSFIKAAFYPQACDFSLLGQCNKYFSMLQVSQLVQSFQYYGDLIAQKLTLIFEKKIPVLLMLGENDLIAPARMQLTPLQSLAFEIESHIIPQASHMTPITHPKELSTLIEKFTQSCDSKSNSRIIRYPRDRDIFISLE